MNLLITILKIKKIPETDYIIYAIRSNKLEEAKKIYSNFIKILKKSNKKPKIIFLSFLGLAFSLPKVL